VADDGYTTILEATDAAQGELFAELLQSEGIEARFHRVSSTLIGMPTGLVAMAVDVPVEDEARARALLADLAYVGSVETADREAAAASMADGADAPTDEPLSTRRPFLALGFAIFLPGGAHLYARRPWTTLVLALGTITGVTLLLALGGRQALSIAFAVWLAAAVCDAVAGTGAVRARAPYPRNRQILTGLVLLASALALSSAVGLGRLERIWHLSRYAVSCDHGTITVRNGGGGADTVKLSNLKVAVVGRFGPPDLIEVGPRPQPTLDLGPGEQGTITLEASAWLIETCGLDRSVRQNTAPPDAEWPRRACGFLFDFAPGGAGGEPLDAFGICIPRGPGETAGKLELR
jgi:hypothetical protein